MNKAMETWKRKLVKLEEGIKQLNNQKIILTNILIELNRRIKIESNKNGLAYTKQLQEEISYLDEWINAYLKSIKECKNKLNEFEQRSERGIAQDFIQKPLVKHIAPLIILLLIITSLFLLKPSTTGYAVFSKETAYNESLNLKLNESGNYTWTLDKQGKISSIKTTGGVIGNGTVKIYIEKDGKKYLIYKNR